MPRWCPTAFFRTVCVGELVEQDVEYFWILSTPVNTGGRVLPLKGSGGRWTSDISSQNQVISSSPYPNCLSYLISNIMSYLLSNNSCYAGERERGSGGRWTSDTSSQNQVISSIPTSTYFVLSFLVEVHLQSQSVWRVFLLMLVEGKGEMGSEGRWTSDTSSQTQVISSLPTSISELLPLQG